MTRSTAIGTVSLRPPLSVAWASPGGRTVRAVAGGVVVARHGEQGQVVGIDRKGRHKWMSKGWTSGLGVLGDVLVATVEFEDHGRIQMIDLVSGKVLREIEEEGASVGVVAPEVVAASLWQRGSILSLDPTTLERRWERRVLPEKGRSGEWQLPSELAYSEGLIIASLLNAEKDEGRLVALDAGTGEQVWWHRVEDADASGKHPWHLAASDGLVVVTTTQGTAAFRLWSGDVAWRSPLIVGNRTLYAGKAYVRRKKLYNALGLADTFSPDEIVVLDIETGKIVWKRDYPELDGRGTGNTLVGWPAVSETHMFVGDVGGTLHAFDARTGELVWSHRPKELREEWGYSYLALPLIDNGRLFVATEGATCHVLCYEEAGDWARDSVAVEGDGRDDDVLRFEVVEVHEGRSIVDRKPYHVDRGEWIVLKCRLGEATLFIATQVAKEDGLFPSCEGRLWVPSRGDGDRLCALAGQALGRKRVEANPSVRVRQPRRLAVTVLGAGSDREGREKDDWIRTKWTGDGGSPEFYIGWSLKERRGAIGEKDGAYRRALLELFASLVARSQHAP